jgi:hypothetical protein
MEAAHRGQARNITLISRPRDRHSPLLGEGREFSLSVTTFHESRGRADSQTQLLLLVTMCCYLQNSSTSPLRPVHIVSNPSVEVRGARRRWVVPISKQFAFLVLSHAPLPRAWRCWALDAWLRHLYWFCMLEHMAPARGSACAFTGQCSDAFFRLAHRVRLSYHTLIPRVMLRAHARKVRSGPARIIPRAKGARIGSKGWGIT